MGPSAALGTTRRKTGRRTAAAGAFFSPRLPNTSLDYFVWTCGRAAARIEMRTFVVVRLAYHRSYWAATASACASHWCGRFWYSRFAIELPEPAPRDGLAPLEGWRGFGTAGWPRLLFLPSSARLRSGRIGVGAVVPGGLNFATPGTTRSARATRTRASSPSPPPGRDPSPPCTPSRPSSSCRACSGP